VKLNSLCVTLDEIRCSSARRVRKLRTTFQQTLQALRGESANPVQRHTVGQKVLLSTINFKLVHPGTCNLSPKWVGLFEVTERIGKVVYKLELSPNLKMHDVFHVQLLKKYRDNGKVQPPPPSIENDDSLEYEVGRVLGHREVKRGKGTRKEFLVKWPGMSMNIIPGSQRSI
jgi:hypothetical protein